MATMNVSLRVNGQSVAREVEPRTLLVDLIRENLSLTGTHVGCDTSQCGACVVHVNGNSVKACTMFAWQADGGTSPLLKASRVRQTCTLCKRLFVSTMPCNADFVRPA